MKVIIAGGREITDFAVVTKAIEEANMDITEVVSGTARGVDALGERWAFQNKIPIKPMPAKWHNKGYFDRGAGFKRNKEMAEYADALIAVWDGASSGTKNMIKWAEHYKLKIYIYNTTPLGG